MPAQISSIGFSRRYASVKEGESRFVGTITFQTDNGIHGHYTLPDAITQRIEAILAEAVNEAFPAAGRALAETKLEVQPLLGPTIDNDEVPF